MDNVNTVEVKTNTDENEWIVLRWSDKQENLSDEIQIKQTEDNDIKTSCTNVKTDNLSDNVPVQTSENNNKDLESEIQIMQRKNYDKVQAELNNTSDDVSTQLTMIQKMNCEIYKNTDEIEIIQTKDFDIKTPYTNTESDDISEGISVITESDTDDVNTNFFQTFKFIRTYEFLRILEAQVNKQVDMNVFIACVLGIVIGLALSLPFMATSTCPKSNEIDAERLKIEIHSIVNACKDLKEVNTMLNEIKAHIPIEKKVYMENIWQLLKNINPSTKMSNEHNGIFMESVNSNLYLLDQLQISVYVLSTMIDTFYNSNNLLKNEINKTLDIVNNTKIFYKNLILSNTQNIDDINVMQFLQSATNEIRYTSQSLHSDLVEKISKIMLNVHNKYDKTKRKLSEKLCHLNNLLSDGNAFLKQLTENNQLFRNYEKSCFLNKTSRKFNGKTNTKKKYATAEIPLTKEKYGMKAKRSKQKKYPKLNDPIEKVSNNDNLNIQEKNISQDKIKIKNNKDKNVKPTNNHKSKLPKQDNQQTNTADWQFERSRMREQLRQLEELLYRT